MPTIQWYPGHMAKAKRQVQENLKYVDFVIEVVDARLPLSSRNPMLDAVLGEKPRLVVLAKADLAENSGAWIAEFAKIGLQALAVDARENSVAKKIVAAAKVLLSDKLTRNAEKGIQNTILRAMVIGIPNAGKSTLLNSLAGKKSARTGNKPGVTQSQQWIRSNPELEILDTPGILWPKFEDPEVGLKLALTGAIKEDIVPQDEVVIWGLRYFTRHYDKRLQDFYKLSELTVDIPELVVQLTEKLGFRDDYDRFYQQFLNAVRSGKLGRFCLDDIH
ncbi:MAG: ribosome biogenesis GTPase YlqF [Streptococcaceae bacterium]|nr:ribosome biogenesis GTPase YlqF [Streptococcaceae bacterium]